MAEYIAVMVAVVAALSSIVGGIVTARGNSRTVQLEKTLPSYEALAGRVSGIDETLQESYVRERKARERADKIEARAEKLEDCYDGLKAEMRADREWIKQAVALAEITGAIVKLGALPDWIDLDSESMRQRREEMRNRYDQ